MTTYQCTACDSPLFSTQAADAPTTCPWCGEPAVEVVPLGEVATSYRTSI